MNPKEDPRFGDEDENSSKEDRLRQDAEGVVNELKNFLSSIQNKPQEDVTEPDPAPEPPPFEGSAPEEPRPPEPEPEDSTPTDPFPFTPESGENPFGPPPSEKAPEPIQIEPTVSEGENLRMGDAGIPPKEPPAAEKEPPVDPSDQVPELPPEPVEGFKGKKPEDDDFWEGNVLGWPEGEFDPRKGNRQPEDIFKEEKPRATDLPPQAEPQSEEKTEPALEPERPIFDPFAPDPSDPPSVPPSPEDPKRGAQNESALFDTESPMDPRAANPVQPVEQPGKPEDKTTVDSPDFDPEALKNRPAPTLLPLEKEGESEEKDDPFANFTLDDMEDSKPPQTKEEEKSEAKKEPERMDQFAPPEDMVAGPLPKENIDSAAGLNPEIVVGPNLIPKEKPGPDLDDLRKSFPKGPSEEEKILESPDTPSAPIESMGEGTETGETAFSGGPPESSPSEETGSFTSLGSPLGESKEESLFADNGDDFFGSPAAEAAAAQEPKEPRPKQKGKIQISVVVKKGQKEKAQSFILKLREFGAKLAKPLDIEGGFIHEWEGPRPNPEEWKRASEMAGAEFIFALVDKADTQNVKDQIQRDLGKGWVGRVIPIERVGLRTMYADILIQLGRLGS